MVLNLGVVSLWINVLAIGKGREKNVVIVHIYISGGVRVAGKILELFSGTASVGREFQKRGWELTTVDIEPDFKPDICADVLDLDLVSLGNPDVVWASPPCTTFSVASISTHWGGGFRAYEPKTTEAEHGLALVEQTLYILRELQPRFWFIENPRGVLRKLPIMAGLQRTTVTYCQYGDKRMKPTDIWGTVDQFKWRPMCKNGDKCHEPAPRGAKTGTQGLEKVDRSRIPEALGRELCEQVEAMM